MPLVRFTANLAVHTAVHDLRVSGATVHEVLRAAFIELPQARSYVLDDQGALRTHMAVFVDAEQIRDRTGLSDPVAADSIIDIIQALSGG
jgi:sulfur-carrier protein